MNARYANNTADSKGGERNGGGGWRRLTLASCVTLGLAATMTLLPTTGFAQSEGNGDNIRFDDSAAAQATYSDGAAPTGLPPAGATDPNADAAAVQADAANSGPVRMARFTVVSGDVTWRGGTDGDWTSGVTNMPLRQGAQVWVSNGGRAEIQFDDGSRLRLDSNTLITLQTLYSDTKGEYTEITLNDGQVAMRATNQFSFYQVNTPLCSVKSAGPSKFRVGAGAGVQVAVRQGQASVQGTGDHARLHSGDYIDLADTSSTYNIVDLPASDAWDAYNDARDREIDALAAAPTAQHLPTNIATSAGDLDAYGTWRNDPEYGWVWVPRVTDAEWRPYYAGHWTWVEPFGWTWVSSEPWGWAPYHYGTWVHAGWGWSWVPGPTHQYWSPGTVAFYQDRGQVAWVPLAPREVHYPSTIAIGFHSGNWSAYFAIGGAAVYYPGEHNVCEPRPWAPTYLNHVTYVRNVTNVNVTNVTINHNTYVTNVNNNYHFVASNARYGGACSAPVAGFGTGRNDHYIPVQHGDAFVHNASVVCAPVGGRPMAGPSVWHPTQASYSPTRVFTHETSAPRPVFNQPIYRASPPPAFAHTVSTPPQPGQRFIDTPHRFGGGTVGSGNVTGNGNVGGIMTTRPTQNGGLQDYLHGRGTSGGNPTTPATTTTNTPAAGTIIGGTARPNPVRPTTGQNYDRYNNRVGNSDQPVGTVDRSARATSPAVTPSTTTGTGTATTPFTGGRSTVSGAGGGRVFRGGVDRGVMNNSATEDRGNTAIYGHAPVERSSDNRSTTPTTPNSATTSQRSVYRPLHNLATGRDTTSKDTGSRDSGNRDAGSRNASTHDSGSGGHDGGRDGGGHDR